MTTEPWLVVQLPPLVQVCHVIEGWVSVVYVPICCACVTDDRNTDRINAFL
jgi:hypothetical protein